MLPRTHQANLVAEQMETSAAGVEVDAVPVVVASLETTKVCSFLKEFTLYCVLQVIEICSITNSNADVLRY